MGAVKVATCCYCGSKAALVLRGDSRHELTCGQCGAPLRMMKMLKSQPASTQRGLKPGIDHHPRPQKGRYAQHPRHRKQKKRKGLFHHMVSEIWDEIEDIFD